ncbi:hypothetical protein [Rhodococcus sp. ACS1]|uniref:hypothetical protein n=1 Tax=Rhodococcus sp. ACS1 TaxID=2028570 RepID=UPI00117B6B44|nr:hypothetical protein [Rhodococcus sp. ACS1]
MQMKTEPVVYMTHRDEVQIVWVTGNPSKGVSPSSTRLVAADLGDAQRQSSSIPIEDREASPLLLEIEVLIDTTAREARRALARLENIGAIPHAELHACDPRRRPMRYIGTVQGLSGLIQDICAVGIADGVVLIPLAPNPTEELIAAEFAELIVSEVAP